MRIHFFTAPFYFAFIWFKVQGSRFRVQGSRFKVQGSGFRVQGSGGGFAAFFRRWYSRIAKANTGYVEKKNNDGQSLPRVGKVASGASRIGY